MEWGIVVIFVAAWWYSGYRGFVYWWTRDFDFTNKEVGIASCIAIIGPIAWAMGAAVHGELGEPRVICPKRNTPPENGHE